MVEEGASHIYVRETMSIITSMVWNTTLALEPLSSHDREPIPRVHIWQTQLAGMACGPAPGPACV